MGVSLWSDLLKEAEDNEFKVLEPGEYDLIITETSNKPSAAGNKVFNFTAKVETGPHAGYTFKANIVLSTSNPKALPFFFRKMGALGLDARFFASEPSDDQVSAAMKGKRFFAKTSIREWGDEGNKRKDVDIQEFHPARGGVAAPAPVAAAPAPAVAPAPAPVNTPPVAAVQAPPVAQPTAPPAPAPAPAVPATADPWGSTPPVMPGLGGDPF